MDAIPVLLGYFGAAVLFFAVMVSVLRRLEDSDPRHRRYGIRRDRADAA